VKTIVLTGATSGIGREVALQLLKSGHRVVAAARDMKKAEAVASELMENSGNGRIVNTSSRAHRRNIYNFDDIEWVRQPYDGVATYSQSKLFNLLFSLNLEKLLENKKTTVNTVHPGYVRTELFSKMGERSWYAIPDAAQGARSTLHAALSPELEDISGKYIYLEGEDPGFSNLAKDEVMAEKLWRVSLGIFQNI
jgi:NAD(P)-dependent dehydrogenase (short-subunit alcohol dehydrogenase family)